MIRKSAQNHTAVVQDICVDEVAIGGEAGVVPIFDMCAGHFVAPFIGTFAFTAGPRRNAQSARASGALVSACAGPMMAKNADATSSLRPPAVRRSVSEEKVMGVIAFLCC
ncbi:hypothetical protein SAMN02927900_04732 [Rhizobium mongolense subsp. loessense]|uniref:Uncharacterized protein n=1 Tax=Rhizobium mongolense subsp. loessense TaxID=158890 RepID=A0A1G4T637_9HYPH|nr:hypothetical protein SAMN02927900_04732 [Rhizobium mongolense subsp. loessense]